MGTPKPCPYFKWSPCCRPLAGGVSPCFPAAAGWRHVLCIHPTPWAARESLPVHWPPSRWICAGKRPDRRLTLGQCTLGNWENFLRDVDFFFFLFCLTTCCSVTKSCPILCDTMNCSLPDFPVLHCLQEFAQVHVHWVSDAIQLSHPFPDNLIPCKMHMAPHWIKIVNVG